MTKYVLISFKACPWVQRAAIVFREKKVDFEFLHIASDNRPDWFLAISPHKKVPVLRIDDSISLFESNAIVEYLDEVIAPRLHPVDPVTRAMNRAWTDYLPTFSATVLSTPAMAKTEADYKQAIEKIVEPFALFEAALAKRKEGDYFNGKDYSLVDVAYAPFFQRHFYIDRIMKLGQIQKFPKLNAWAQALVQRPSTHSFPEPEAENMYRTIIKGWGTWVSQHIDNSNAPK